MQNQLHRNLIKGQSRKKDKIPAETMVARLKQEDGLIYRNWVAMLVVTVSKVKQYISQKSQKDKKAAAKATMASVAADAELPEQEEEATAQEELTEHAVEESIENEM